MGRYFKKIAAVGNGNYNYFSKSKGLSYPKLSYFGTKTRVEFSGSSFRQNKIENKVQNKLLIDVKFLSVFGISFSVLSSIVVTSILAASSIVFVCFSKAFHKGE